VVSTRAAAAAAAAAYPIPEEEREREKLNDGVIVHTSTVRDSRGSLCVFAVTTVFISYSLSGFILKLRVRPSISSAFEN
jgi:hypothetical protein